MTCTSGCPQVECILETYNLIYTECVNIKDNEWIAQHCIENSGVHSSHCPHRKKVLAISLLCALFDMKIDIVDSTKEDYQSMKAIQNKFLTIISALPKCIVHNAECTDLNLIPLYEYLPSVCWDTIWLNLGDEDHASQDHMSSIIIAVLMLELLRTEMPAEFEIKHLIAKLCATDSIMLCNLIRVYTNDILHEPIDVAHTIFEECASILDCLFSNDSQRRYVAFSKNTLDSAIQQLHMISRRASSMTGQNPVNSSIHLKRTLERQLSLRIIENEEKMEYELNRECLYDVYSVFKEYNRRVHASEQQEHNVLRYSCIVKIRDMYKPSSIRNRTNLWGNFAP